MADRFSFFESYKEVFDSLNAEDTKALLNAIMNYAFCEEEPQLDGLLKAVFFAIKPHLDSSIKISEGAKKGGKACKPSEKACKPSEKACKPQKKACNEIEVEVEEEIEKEKEIENESGSKNNSIAPSPEDSKPIFQLPLVDKTLFNVTQPDIDKYRNLYPAVDVEQEFRNMIGWCDGNPTKLKTRSGIKRFINSWLSSTQNKPRAKQGRASPKYDSGLTPFQEGLGEIMYGGLKHDG